MSEKTSPKTETKAPETKDVKKEVAKEKSNVVKAKETTKREKVTWDLSRCLKYARRFADEVTWASAAPASYKSAMAHGWRDQCLAAQTAGGKVVTAQFTKKTSQPVKRAA